ncbi:MULTISPECIES: hypothetical protein [unclassified Mesorhizobium]|uniref:hypothetical protein n=1 Tax=unclassified Mesorhizobium TaxID=325217 RepID=UPI003335A12C
MRLAIICAAMVIAVSTAAVAHEKKRLVNTASACADLSRSTIKKTRETKLDRSSTGTVSSGISKDKSEPRLGYEMVNPAIISIY